MPSHRKYGLSDADYKQLLAFQDGACAICQRNFTASRPACVDHDHKTWNVRGLLCNRCNGFIGYLNENVLVLEHAALYLGVVAPADLLWPDNPRRPKDAPPLEYLEDSDGNATE